MKLRLGFVSNSSSSSFIINRDSYPTVFSLAKHMLEIRNNDGEDWEDDNGSCDEIKKMDQAIAKHIDPNTPVTFQTCNYDTFITPKDNKYYVSTCNNTDWEDLNGVEDCGGGHDEGEFDELEETTIFWDLSSGVKGKKISWDEAEKLRKQGKIRCTHYEFYKTSDGNIECPDCWREQKSTKDMVLDVPPPKQPKPEYKPSTRVRLR